MEKITEPQLEGRPSQEIERKLRLRLKELIIELKDNPKALELIKTLSFLSFVPVIGMQIILDEVMGTDDSYKLEEAMSPEWLKNIKNKRPLKE